MEPKTSKEVKDGVVDHVNTCVGFFGGGGSSITEMEKAMVVQLIGKKKGDGGSGGGGSSHTEMEKAINGELIGKKEGNCGSGGGGTSCGGRGGDQIPQPPPPFLRKTYDLVDDPNTNELISWSSTRKSIVIWDHIRFAHELLPKHFRHSNFASFIYQLNNYGFKKIGLTQYEYENPWFQADKMHLLNNIKRRAQLAQNNNNNVQQKRATRHDFAATGSDEAEIKKLKKDYNTMKTEILEIKQQQDATERGMAAMEMRIENTTVLGKQEVFKFMAEAIMNPLFVRHFIHGVAKKQRVVVHQSAMGSMKLVDLNEKSGEELETTKAEGTSFEKSLMMAEKLLEEEDLGSESAAEEQMGPVQSRIVMDLEDLITKPQDRAWAEFAKELMEKSGLP